MKRIDVNLIKTSDELQARESVSPDKVSEYKEALEMGQDFPPVTIFLDGNGNHWLCDGYMRLEAHKLAKIPDIAAEVRSGGFKEAKLFAAGANATHGQPRSYKDKTKAVLMILGDSAWKDRSDRWVAEKAKVSHTFVAKVRESSGQPNGKRVARDGRNVNPKNSSGNESTKATRNSTNTKKIDFDWPTHLSRLGNMVRSIDDLCVYYKQQNNPLAEGLRRKLSDWHIEFREFYKSVSNKEAPEENKQSGVD